MSDVSIIDKIEARDRPKAPPWPKQGTPEFDERIARMREGQARRKAREASQKVSGDPEPEPIDLGRPEPVAMPEREKKTAHASTASAVGKRSGKGNGFDEKDVHAKISHFFGCLAALEGHEHWRRERDEISLLSEPGTRILNRISPEVIEAMQKVSDPAALVFACITVIGPSLMLEVQNVRKPRGEGRRLGPSREQYTPQQAGGGDRSGDSAGAGPVPSNGANIPTAHPAISTLGI